MSNMSSEPAGQMGFVKSAIARTQRKSLAKKVAKAPTPSGSKMNPAMQAALARRLAKTGAPPGMGKGPNDLG